ncbi:hypothetical protein [Superficieibacter sp.]|uniref:hypothetical protein n=1 Tax=Superficieibacter sp. TaxID=2303322 RepID=UPI0028AEF598|nr:hypothetical protein [Superficieibacter sp.]
MNIKPFTPVILFFPLWLPSGLLCAAGQLDFRGSVIESGCWHESNLPMVLCQKRNTIERHIIIENLNTTISSPSATVEQVWLDDDKQITLLRIIYD